MYKKPRADARGFLWLIYFLEIVGTVFLRGRIL